MRIGLDLDGTLLDCRLRQTTLLATLCRACALELDKDQYWQLKRQGCSNREALRHMSVDDRRADTLAALWEQAIEDAAWLRFDKVLLGTLETLRRWRALGHSLHLLSARRNHANARWQLRSLGLECFDNVDFVDPFAPNAKRAALTVLRPDVYIGDTERDARCADAAGVPPMLVSSGLRDQAHLQRSGNWPVTDRLADICLPTERQAGQ